VFNSGIVRAPETTRPEHYFAHFGLFVTVAAAFVALRYYEVHAERRLPGDRNPLLTLTSGRLEALALGLFMTGLTVFTWRLGLTVVALSLVGIVFLLNLAWLELRAAERNAGRLFATLLFALGLAIAAGVDVVTVRDDIQRMNTVFKFYMQAWQIFALASAVGGWYVMTALWQVRGGLPAPRPGKKWAAISAAAAGILLLYGSSIFVFSGTPARQSARFADLSPTLDGLAYMEVATYREDRGRTSSPAVEIRLADDLPLIRWLRENVEGSPVIVEAVGPLYHWTGRISVNTGLPAVIGWDWHQTQQRWDYSHLVQERRRATQAFFVSGDERAAELYLRKYNVSYVVVGTEELAYGTAEGLAKLATMDALTEVFRSGDYVIYRVDQTKIAPPL
jgi:uncharacterized membrane protein